MKKFCRYLILSLCLFFSFGLYADEHTLSNVPKDFIGTYMPVQLEMLVKEYMSYEKALDTIAESHYDILSLEDNICYSQVRFSDGYAVYAKDFEKWSFVKRGDERFILDENGLSYKRISTKKADYEAFAEKILNIIFVDAIHNKNITIKGEYVTIYGKEYRFNLWPSYTDDYGALVLSNCVLKIEGLSANIYQTEQSGHWGSKRTDKIVQTIPLFYWDDSDLSSLKIYRYEDSKEDLRLLRNLIYAKHGYKFKSDDLQKIFSDFDWYKVNDKFSESSFSNLEKNIIREIQEREARLGN